MARDMSQRVTMARVDNAERQGKVFAARRLIYEKNSLVTSSAIEALLRDASWVPTSVSLISFIVFRSPYYMTLQNAFSERLSPLGFNLFSTLLPDFMHEVELGGWKALFIHLLRMLSSIGEERLVALDQRYV